MKVEASAPSNIALIKYMGKVAGAGNRPANASLSYTLENLRTFVTLEPSDQGEDRWEPLKGFPEISLSETGRAKFLTHFQRLKAHWQIEGRHIIQSANNFPSDCGLASSASSFAALTLATYELAKTQRRGLDESREALSILSRQGSGSSCRSLFSPWAEWRDEGAVSADLSLRLEHGVVIVDASKKQVSSSEAHARVAGSSLWPGRIERADARLNELKSALALGDWRAGYETCWNEFWDMHALFEACRPPFGFMTEGSLRVLNRLRKVWETQGDGPLVTMDAGANVHLLLRSDQKSAAQEWVKDYSILWSWT